MLNTEHHHLGYAQCSLVAFDIFWTSNIRRAIVHTARSMPTALRKRQISSIRIDSVSDNSWHCTSRSSFDWSKQFPGKMRMLGNFIGLNWWKLLVWNSMVLPCRWLRSRNWRRHSTIPDPGWLGSRWGMSRICRFQHGGICSVCPKSDGFHSLDGSANKLRWYLGQRASYMGYTNQRSNLIGIIHPKRYHNCCKLLVFIVWPWKFVRRLLVQAAFSQKSTVFW